MLFSFCLNWLYQLVIYFYMFHIWGKLPKNSSFHGNHISGIYGVNSRTKRSIDIPNRYISEQNGMFKVFSTKFCTKSWHKKFLTLIYLKVFISHHLNNTCRA